MILGKFLNRKFLQVVPRKGASSSPEKIDWRQTRLISLIDVGNGQETHEQIYVKNNHHPTWSHDLKEPPKKKI